MANPEHLKILKQGVEVWNRWRKENPKIEANLREANLNGAELSGSDLGRAYLGGANLGGAKLSGAELSGSDLSGAHLFGAKLSGAKLNKANLNGAELSGAHLFGAKLSEANLVEANLVEAELSGAHLFGAKLSEANLGGAKLSEANLGGAKLRRANLHGVNLFEAKLSRADLSGANLREANLSGADLREANLIEAKLSRADFRGADLRRANLSRTDLREADLHDIDLSKANLREANLSAVSFYGTKLNHANLESVDLRRCDMIDSNLDGAVLTGAKLWESKRSGWSIKEVICEYAYFDREGGVKTEFKPGEFEKLYSEQTKIVLHYEDGLTQFEVTTLPALIRFIESKHAGSSLRLRTIGEDVGGASVTVAVDELGDADVSALQDDFVNYKERIRQEVKRDAEIEMKFLQREVNLLTGIIERKMGDTFNIHQVTGVVKAESSTVNQNINANDLDGISKLITEILAARSEIEKVLPPEKVEDFNDAFEVIEEQSKAKKKNWEKVKKGAETIKNLLDGVGDTAGKWMPIVEKLSQAAQSLGMG
ncbi:pentapeptide repeat-containing protein [Prosthecochloris sp.]|uniref:pentapeptide repeat-containing protein n=1 Tax=Prosthecochloris sp. TaxID=290513 RepID=UPI00257E36B5|nr:pentapeptide repeat-containing protein [Prosthecochloris sp.]